MYTVSILELKSKISVDHLAMTHFILPFILLYFISYILLM